MKKDCYPSFTGCLRNNPCPFVKNAYFIRRHHCTAFALTSLSILRVIWEIGLLLVSSLNGLQAIFILDMVVSILFLILGFLFDKVGLFEKYAFALLTTVLGMGWKRDSNHFGPKWEKYLRGLFGHLKVNSLLCLELSSSHYFINLVAMIYCGWNRSKSKKLHSFATSYPSTAFSKTLISTPLFFGYLTCIHGLQVSCYWWQIF